MSENVVIKKDRTVTVPASEAKIGVQYDHNVNIITFDCPRYPDDDRNVDMSTMQIYINYMLPDKTLGSYLAENVKVDTNNPDTIHFDWKITRNVTQVKGALQALVCIKKVDAEGNELYHWNTDLIQSFRVGEGMECLETISSDYADVISQLLTNMNTVVGKFEALSADVTARTSEETLQGLVNNAASDEKLGSIVNAYMEANPVGINVDDTLTVSGDAADAKITGDRISELKSELAELEDIVAVKSPNLFDTSKLVKKSINDSGVPITNLNATALLNIPIEGGMSIVCNGFAQRTDIWLGFVYNENDELIDRFGIANYDSTYSGEASWGHYGNKYTAIENAKYFSIYSIDSTYNLGSNYQIEYGDTISEYTPYGAIFFKYDDEIKSIAKKQDKLIAGKGIIIEDNVITCTVEGGGSSEISYEYESKLMSDSYTTLAEISNPKELLFAENNVINEKAKFLFGNHMIIAENNYFVVSQDKTISSTTKGGSLEISFEYDGSVFEIGCSGLANYRFKVDEGNGWQYLDEKPMNVSTQNGYRTYTQIRFDYPKHRKIIIETNSPVWCLRYDARYQVSPLTLNRTIALFIGSSITEGSASGEFPMASYGAVCSNEFGWEFINLGVGGRGIITPFDSRPSVLDAVSDITQFTDAKYIFIGGSINDSSNNASELTSGLEAIIDTVRESLPDATIVVLGTWSPQPDSNNSVHAITNNAVKSGALTKGCAFIDSMNAQVYDASGNVVQNGTTWVTGTFANASGDNDMSTIGNCERIYTHENGSTDHTHPGRVGHYYIGMRLASACRALKLK